MEEITGKIQDILFSNKGTGYYVLRVIGERQQAFVACGTFPGCPISVGSKAKFSGVWENHQRFGRRFASSSCEVVPEKGRNGVITYLSNNVKSIGVVTAGKLYGAFGDDLLSILDTDPERIRECGFLTRPQADAIIEEWKKSSEQRTVSIYLTNLGLTASQVRSAYVRFGADTTKLVQANPYRLYECQGIGFPTADQVARKLGVGCDDRRRVSAMIVFSITDLSHAEGHMYVTSEQVLKHVKRLFRHGLDHFSHGDYIADSDYYHCLADLKREGIVVSDGVKLYLRDNWLYESEAATCIASMLGEGAPDMPNLEVFLESFERRRGIRFSDQQRQAFLLLYGSRICVVSGYPGTGKTTLISAFVDLFDSRNFDYFLLSPTGIAAKRLSQVTGKPASTIHRALGYSQEDGWKFNATNRFHADAVIVDEMSMVDGETFFRLVSALPSSSILVLVGDSDQLPSVGAGHVLNCLMRCPDVPHVSLTRIYRQEDESDIISVAHSIIAGEPIDPLDYDPRVNRELAAVRRQSQFVFIPDRIDVVVEEICKLTARMKDKGANFQVIAPKYDGDLGVNNLNRKLREVLNPIYASERAQKIKHGSCDLYEGDRVMVIKNDYDRVIFNGDVGKVERISIKDDEVDVRIFNWFDQESSVPRYVDRVFTFKIDECRTMLNVAYACTAHKVQGQEFDYIVMPMTMQYGVMLYRNLIYTAVTRAKKKVFLFGEPRAFTYAVENERETVRNSDLGRLISDGLPARSTPTPSDAPSRMAC